MKFGVPLLGLGPRHYPAIAAAAEENGFESVFVPEHLLMPAEIPPSYPYSESGYSVMSAVTPLYDPWVVLASVTAVTKTIRLSTNIYVVPLRHPFVTARSIITLDRLSGGRVTLGGGVGWLQEEFDAIGLPFHQRGKMMDEIVPLLRRLWTDEVIEHHGTFFDFGPIRFEPKPLQKPCIPIELGGHSTAALERAGRLGDGWMEVGSGDFDTFTARRDIVLRARQDSPRADEPFLISSGLGTTLDRVKRCEELGVGRVIVGPRSDLRREVKDQTRLSPEDFTEWCKRFADEVISKFA
ncbi:MAG TPA: LLM class F420-dependent oxidoreductase [Ilumatobacter sp.]|nr:LLM class F420-dependent oxidoreductase [Ilumatobacter sp.]